MRKFPVGKLNEFKQEHLGALISRILNSRYEFAHGRARDTFAISLLKELKQCLAYGPHRKFALADLLVLLCDSQRLFPIGLFG